ncbi:MAG: hypothetical protein FJX40_10905 [Alphaproteobacteria bacterium]|nr:hypothetical protein [Alphaproteobacteria bacterium]
MTFLALALVTPLGGCASLTGSQAPSCDGAARRPLNRSLWNWESASPIAAAPIEAPAPPPVPPAREGEPLIRKGEIGPAQSVARAAARPVFDIAASTRRCGGADHG